MGGWGRVGGVGGVGGCVGLALIIVSCLNLMLCYVDIGFSHKKIIYKLFALSSSHEQIFAL